MGYPTSVDGAGWRFRAAAERLAAFLLPRTAWREMDLRSRTPEDRRLLDLLDPVAEAAGYAIVRLRLMGGGDSRMLQIMAERPEDGDMDIDDCARLSRAVSQVLDAADPVTGEYRLEVSSPGVDRPLTRIEDFDAYEGYTAKLELDRMAEGRKRFKGTLVGTERIEGETHVALDQDGEAETTLVPFAWIIDAKLSLTDDLMKRGAERRAARLIADTKTVQPELADEEDA